MCLARIEQLLREVAATFPTTTVWWAKVVQRSFPSGAATAGMTGWNTALDRAASRWPNLIVWDWPTALATANPPIVTDVAGIHPNSSAQYVKRSTLMAEHITTRMSSARFDGRRGALPAADTSGLGFAPVTETTIYSTLANGVRFAAGETRDIDLSAEPAVDDSAQALALTVSAKNSADAGWLVVFRCGDPMPPTSNVNFAAGAFRTAQAVTKITGTGHICVHTSTATDVIVSIQGNFLPAGGAALSQPVALGDLPAGVHTLDVVATNDRGQRSSRRIELYTGQYYLATPGTRWSEGRTVFSLRNVAPRELAGSAR